MKNKVTIMNLPLFGSVPTLHWAFSDRTGEMIVVEPDRDGLKVYRNTIGVMTNSPGYSWHRLNLLNYAGIRDLDYDVLDLESDRLNQCFSGSGAQGLPGDWSSPSRFIRLAFLKKYCVKGRDESQGVANMLHLFQSAAFPLGIVRITEQGTVTEYDKDISPYDYTVYTSIMCGGIPSVLLDHLSKPADSVRGYEPSQKRNESSSSSIWSSRRTSICSPARKNEASPLPHCGSVCKKAVCAGAFRTFLEHKRELIGSLSFLLGKEVNSGKARGKGQQANRRLRQRGYPRENV